MQWRYSGVIAWDNGRTHALTYVRLGGRQCCAYLQLPAADK